MPFSIGRAGLTLALPEPLNWQNSGGGTVTLTGSFVVAGSVTDSLRLRDQLLGLAGDLDTPAVALISPAQPRDNGYYKVMSVDCPTTSDSLISGIHYYSIVLQPVPGYANPMFESIITGGLLSNAVGAVTGDMIFFHAVPSAVTEYFKGFGGSLYTRSSADGNLIFYTSGTVSDTARWYLVPSSFYIGGATFEQGSPLQPVVGRQLAQSDVANWRLSNGLVRVTPDSVTPGRLDISHWKGAAWATARIYGFSGQTTAGAINGFTTITILRNSVEECVIRLGCTVAYGVAWGRVFLDIALRRGDRLVRCYLSSDSQSNWRVTSWSAGGAATAITYGAVTLGGFRATANDADGNRYVLLSYQTASPISDLVNGILTQNLATNNTFDVGIGSEIGGSGASAPDDAISIAKQYLAVQGEKQQTVSR